MKISKNVQKIDKFFPFLRELRLNREQQILIIPNRILVIGSQCVNKRPEDAKFQ